MDKRADLTGEELLRFRNGRDLYTYCDRCVHSARTPISGVLGCTLGDDPEVISYSQEIDAGEHEEDNPKCPRFLSSEQATQGEETRKPQTAIRHPALEAAITQEGDFVKELPPEPAGEQFKDDGTCRFCHKSGESCVCKHADKFDEDLEDALEDLRKIDEVPKELVTRILTDSNKLIQDRDEAVLPGDNGDYSARDIPPHEWSPTREDKDEKRGYLEAILQLATGEDVSDAQEQGQFLNKVRDALSGITDAEARKQVVIRLLGQYGGVSSMTEDPQIVDRIIQQVEAIQPEEQSNVLQAL